MINDVHCTRISARMSLLWPFYKGEKVLVDREVNLNSSDRPSLSKQRQSRKIQFGHQED